MTEKEIKEKAELIVEALSALSMGREPNVLSGEVFKKLSAHQNYTQIRDAYIEYLKSFDGKVDTADDIKKMFDFRLEIVSLFDAI